MYAVSVSESNKNKKQASQLLIKKVFAVDVEKVNIINCNSKKRRFKGVLGSTSEIKKAVVTIKTGQTINFD